MATISDTEGLSLGRFCWREVWALIAMFMVYLLGCAAVFMLMALTFPAAHAQESLRQYERLDEVGQGSLLFKQEDGVYVPVLSLNTDVEITISGMIARARLRQEFINQGTSWAEGVYVFPLPEDAAVDHLRMQIGERMIEGQIKERAEAKRVYSQAKQQGRKAALIEQERPNLFTNSVANIGPGERVTVEIEYQQVLRYDGGEFSLRFPMAITPRYIPNQGRQAEVQLTETVSQYDGLGWAVNTQQVPDASRITPPVWQGDKKINPVSMKIELNAGFPLRALASRHHEIEVLEENGINVIQLKGSQVYADRDFELAWSPKLGDEPKAALFSEKVGEDFYHLLMVLPPETGNQNHQPLARELIFVIDTSGSMAGTSIQQAKQALLLAVDSLGQDDRFNIIEFNSNHSKMFSSSQQATRRNLQRARRFVNGLRASGGTNIYPAIEAALRNQEEGQHVRQVVFLTDGSVGNEAQLFGLIDRELQQSRLFTIGIGAAPNSHFMRKAARFGRGSFTYIGDVNEVEDKMRGLFRKLETPVMTDINVDLGDVLHEYYPQRLPDLYAGEPLVLSIKTDSNKIPMQVEGQRQQQHWQSTLDLDNGAPDKGIATLWARRKIADLMEAIYQNKDQVGLRKQIINLALQHHLVSKYTSLVAVDVTPSRPDEAPLKDTAMPVNLPQGQVYSKIFGRQAQTATPAQLQLILGVTLILVATLMWRATKRERP